MAKDTLSLELDGKINLVTRKGKKTTREELDGRVCLEALLSVIMQGLDLLEQKQDILGTSCSPAEWKRRSAVSRKRLVSQTGKTP